MDSFNNKKQALIAAIEEEKLRLEKELTQEDETLVFLRNIWDTSETDQIKLAANTDIIDMLTAIILSDEKRTESISEIRELLEQNRHLYEHIDSKETRALIFTFADLDAHGLYDEFKQAVTPGNKRLSAAKGASIGLKVILRLAGIRKINLYPFMQSIDKYSNYLDGLLCIKIAQDYQKTKSRTKHVIDTSTRRLMDQLGLPEEDVKKDFDLNTTRKIIFQARNYYDRIKQATLNEKRAYRRELVAYETLEEGLDKLLKQGEIKNVTDLLFRISSPTVRIELLKLIYLHNKEIYDELSSEYQKLSSEPSSTYQSLLDKYGISPDLYNITEIMTNSPDELSLMLQSLKELDITDTNIVLELIKHSNPSTIETISTQVSKGIIGSELLKNNISLFLPDSKEYQNFTTNLEFFAEEGFNPHYLRANQELFLLSSDKIKTNIKVLEEYNLLASMKTGIDCRFLVNEELSLGIDTLLELGYEEALVEDLSLLSYQHNFKRLQVLRALNIPVTSVEELKTVLASEKFLVPDDDINTYLYNAVLHQKLCLIEEQVIPSTVLAPYEKTTRTYDINGILISKNKVKKSISAIYEETSTTKLLSALVSNSVLSDEEYETVASSITKTSKSIEYIKK